MEEVGVRVAKWNDGKICEEWEVKWAGCSWMGGTLEDEGISIGA